MKWWPSEAGVTDPDVADLWRWWCRMGDTDAARAAIVRDMLRKANEDRMSVDDRASCRRALLLWAPSSQMVVH